MKFAYTEGGWLRFSLIPRSCVVAVRECDSLSSHRRVSGAENLTWKECEFTVTQELHHHSNVMEGPGLPLQVVVQTGIFFPGCQQANLSLAGGPCLSQAT